MNVLVTGADGFVGRALLKRLTQADAICHAVVRDIKRIPAPRRSEQVIYHQCDLVHDGIGEIPKDINVVIHLAGRAHRTGEKGSTIIELYRRDNVLVTERLVQAAAKANVQRFIYLSSIKVNGEGREQPYNEEDAPAPEDVYGQTKLEAEHALRTIGKKSGLETVILRPPLIYGPEVKANFRSLLKWVSSGQPLPLAGIKNRRSFLFIGNLVAAIELCLQHPGAANQTFLVSDGKDISVPDLIRLLYKEMNIRDKLFFVPVWFLKALGILTGKRTTLSRLTQPCLIDNSKLTEKLNWHPPYSLIEGLRETVRWYATLEKK